MDKNAPTIELAFDRLDEETMLANASSFHELLTKRRTVRNFASTPVPKQIIEDCIAAAGTAPSGANQQPWQFVAINKTETKRAIRVAAEQEESAFYAGRAGDEWLDALRHLGTNESKPFLETAPWLIAIFAQRYSQDEDGKRIKNYYVPESVGIASGLLIAALHNAGLATLTHTPAPMNFLRNICNRPDHEKPIILLVVGYPADDAHVPDIKRKSLKQISTWIEA